MDRATAASGSAIKANSAKGPAELWLFCFGLDCCHCSVIKHPENSEKPPPRAAFFLRKRSVMASPANEIPSALEKQKPKTQTVASLKLCGVIQLNSICTLSMPVSKLPIPDVCCSVAFKAANFQRPRLFFGHCSHHVPRRSTQIKQLNRIEKRQPREAHHFRAIADIRLQVHLSGSSPRHLLVINCVDHASAGVQDPITRKNRAREYASRHLSEFVAGCCARRTNGSSEPLPDCRGHVDRKQRWK